MFGCTSVEVLFEFSALDYITVLRGDEPSIFSPKEIEHLKSIKKIVCNDRNAIVAYALDLGKGAHLGVGRGRTKYTIRVVGYKNSEKVISFEIDDGAPIINEGSLVTESGDCYVFYAGFPSFPSLLDRQLGPYIRRADCALNLGSLGSEVSKLMGDTKSFKPSEWCDAVGRRMKSHGMAFLPIKSQRTVLECPSVKTCHYAMNTHCTAKSPSGTVLLFESKPGWNQRGGPELFTMKNHEPKGGLVILQGKYLKMKFIRSQEELRKLRWK